MSLRMYPEESIVVLTTEERAELFCSVLGPGVDLHFDPELTVPLDEFLARVERSGGRLAVLDEEHFIEARDLFEGLEAYLNGSSGATSALTLIVVCGRRGAGDENLARLVAYCGIYDLVYDARGAELAEKLADVLARPRTRRDVLELLYDAVPVIKRRVGELEPARNSQALAHEREANSALRFSVDRQVSAVEIRAGELNIKIEFVNV